MSVTRPTTAAILKATLLGRVRRLGLGAALAAGLCSVGFVPTAVAADVCANAAVRAQTGSEGLPDCRAYEMVSAPYKQGFPVMPAAFIRFTDDGVVSYRSLGAFAGNAMAAGGPNLYHATRSAAGWLTSSMDPPGSIYETGLGLAAVPVYDESADLRWSLWWMYRRDTEIAADIGFWRRGPDGVFTRVGGGIDTSGGSAGDLSHVIIDGREYVGSGPSRPFAVTNDGQSLAGGCPKEFSPDGRVIVFGMGCVADENAQLWARVAGSATVAVSGSECTREAGDDGGLCNGASVVTYAGGAVDGSRLFFTTNQQLVNDDIDQTNDLYACDIPAGTPVPVGVANRCAPLIEVSGAASDAQVESVVSVSEDGSRAYFVAQGVLADNLDVSGVGALAGAANLYVWQRDAGHPAGQTRYVARLRDGNDVTRGQTTPDGRYLLFVTANQLEPADTDAAAKDVYRYDAVTHTIVRVSVSVAGGGGNGPGLDVDIPDRSAVSADGSTVIFDTAEALSLSDTNGVGDVYSWRDGQVSLISAGGGTAVGVTPSGRDLFFRTAAQVLGADGDPNVDLYDARLGGGFAPAQPPPPCSGDQCQSQRSRPPSLPVPPVMGPGGGVAEVLPVFSVRALSAAQRRALAATGKASLTVTTNTPGTITAKATATIGGRSVTAGSGRQTLTGPGSDVVALTLSKKARTQLRSRGRLTVKVAVSHSKVALDRSVTVKLVYAKTKAKRSVARVSGGRS